MSDRKIPKTLIKKNGLISPETEYFMLNALEMELGAIEYYSEHQPQNMEESLQMFDLTIKMIIASEYRINPEGKIGILMKKVNEYKIAKLWEKLDKLEKNSRKNFELSLLKEYVQLQIDDSNDEIEKNGGADVLQ